MGASASWAYDFTQVASYNFEDETTTPFVSGGGGRYSIVNSGDNSEGSKVVQFNNTNSMYGNNCAYAVYDFSSLTSDASVVKVEFDFWVSGIQSCFTLRDKDNAASQSKSGFNTGGALFSIGSMRTSTNFFGYNNIQISDGAEETWYHVEIIADVVNSKVSYTLKNFAQTTTIASGSELSYFGSGATACTQLDFYSRGADGNPSNMGAIDNVVVSKYVDASNHTYTINAVCEGTTLKEIASGLCATGSDYSAIVNKVVKYDGQYYVLDDATVTGYSTDTYTMGSSDETKEITYTLDESIVWFEEGESNTVGQTVDANYSGGAYSNYRQANKFNSTTIASAGAYKAELYVATGIANGRAFGIFTKEGDTYTSLKSISFSSNKTASAGLYTTDVFCVNAGTTLYTGNTANSLGLDYLIIRKVADIVDASNEFVGAFDFTTAWKAATTTPVTLKPGDSYHYQFVNYSQATVNDRNWQLIVANEANTADVMEIRADWWENLNGDPAEGQWQTYQRGFSSNAANYWENVPSKMNGATVDMTVTFTTDKKFIMSSTTTAADGETSWTYNYTSDNDNNIDLTGNAALTVYLTVALNWLEILSEAQTAVGVTTTAAGKGWATLYTGKGLDFSEVEGLTAYTATLSGSTVTLNAVNDIQAETGVVLKSNTTDATTIYSVPVTTTSTTAKGSLTGSTTEVLTYNGEDSNSYYMLALNSNDEAQFSKLTSGSIAAGKAYLVVAGGGARSLNVVFTDESTGIDSINSGERKVESYYNLNGQRVAALQKGLYIINGKKVIVK